MSSREPARFQIITPTGAAEEERRLPSPGAVLSKAQTLATRAAEPGTWTVREYEDELYRVERLADGTVETWTL